MRRMAIRAGRHLLVLLLLKSLTVDRRVILGDLIHAQRRIISPHEIRVRVALSAYIDHLNRGRLADVAFFPIHRLQTHHVSIATVTR